MKHTRKLLPILIALLGTLISVYVAREQPAPITPAPTSEVQITTSTPESSTTSTIRVSRIVDGDTFAVEINGKEEKVRMLGIDTPESVDPRRPVQCFGKEATQHLSDLIGNKEVLLVGDPTNDDRDKYGRLLRYVYVIDGTDINARMIEDGYAYAYTKFPFEKRDEFLKLQTAARDAGKGLWASTTCRGRR